jgi:hypothetical protein
LPQGPAGGTLPLVRVVASVLLAAALAPVALAGAAPAPSASVLGVVSANGERQLVRLDAVTLQRTASPAVPIPTVYGPALRSPDRSQLVVAANDTPSLAFVDVDRMQSLGTMTPAKAGAIQLIAWPEQRRLYGFGWGCCPARTDILVIDPVERTVLARVPLKGTEMSEAPSADGVAVLTAPLKGIAAARVLAVSRDGTARRITLSRIRAGSKWRGVNTAQRVGTIRQPGFTADPTATHAYVVDAGGLVADVDLATLAVSYHAARTFARAEKGVTGPMRHAQWVGDGRIAVTGTNAQRRKTRNGWQEIWAPAGLQLVDTRSWTSQTVDKKASWFAATPDSVLVVAGGRVTAYGLDGAVRYRLPVASAQAYVDVHGTYAYVWEAKTVSVVDAASGAVAATMAKPDLWLVGGDS